MKHALFDEGIFAFVKPAPGETITPETVMAHCKAIAAYKRPAHVEIWDRDFPLTRSTKVDKLALADLAGPIVEDLKKQGGWDAGQQT